MGNTFLKCMRDIACRSFMLRIFRETEIEEIAVALSARTSSYNSTDIHVLGVSMDKYKMPVLTEYLTILDGSKDGRAPGGIHV